MRWLWLALALAACGTSTEGVATSTSPILTEEDADAGPPAPLASIDESPIVIAGPSRRVTYSPDAPFTAVSFVAEKGHEVAFLVDSRTPGAKPAAWITDNHFVSITSKNTGSGSVFLRFVPDRTGIFYLVLREAALEPCTFLVTSFAFGPPPADEDAGTE